MHHHRQDSWFNYLFGAKESGFYGALNLSTGTTTLFIPRLPADYAVVCGEIYPPEHFAAIYAVDEVLYADDLKDHLKNALTASGPDAKIHLLEGLNTDSGLTAKPATFEGVEELAASVDKSLLFNALSTARVTKSEKEIEVMLYCAYVASNAHVEGEFGVTALEV